MTVAVGPDAVEVKGPRGTLTQSLPPGVRVEAASDQLLVHPAREDGSLAKFHGLGRSLVANAVHGVSQGFKKELDIVGIGYRAEHTGKHVVFALGYSHPIEFDIPADVEIAVDKQTHITVSGIDRQRVGAGGGGHSRAPQA